MKRRYRPVKFREATMATVAQANLIIEEYSAQGYALTLRQLYYQLVARDFIPNEVKQYKRLSSVMTDARYGGYTDWDAIVDRIRRPQIPYFVADKAAAIRDTIEQYRLDRQIGQETYLEIWCEKDAISEILSRVTEEYHIRLMINRGYSSATAMRKAALRFMRKQRDQDCKILYFGDHDPSGLDMIRDIRDRLREFGADVEVDQIALTMEQIEEHNPPPNPAKETDPRADWYIGEFGDTSWEIDALSPEILNELLVASIQEEITLSTYNAMKDKEQEDINKLQEIADELDLEDDEEEE